MWALECSCAGSESGSGAILRHSPAFRRPTAIGRISSAARPRSSSVSAAMLIQEQLEQLRRRLDAQSQDIEMLREENKSLLLRLESGLKLRPVRSKCEVTLDSSVELCSLSQYCIV